MFPIFAPEGLGPSGLLALIAVTHVFVAHFAVGGGLYLVLTERWGLRAGLPDVVAHAKQYSRFFLLLTVVFGALSGVGIWFVIGISGPDTTFLLIRTFVWGWATEWCFFFIELVAALVYYKTWDRIDPERHLRVGWVYAMAGVMTLLVINGILSFMLTPGAWPETKSFWDGLFNPTYLGSSLLRLGLTVTIAGCFGLLTGGRAKADEETRRRILGRAARWVTAGVLIAVPGYFWTRAGFPPEVTRLLDLSLDDAKGAISLLRFWWWVGGGIFAFLALLGVLLAFVKPRRLPLPFALAILLLAFCGYGCGEYAREALRKPYGVRGVIYANGLRPADVERFRAEGFLASTRDAARAATAEPRVVGELMYGRQCAVCHTKDGYRGLRDLMDGWDEGELKTFVYMLHAAKPGQETLWKAMPPLAGNEAEVSALHGWLRRFLRRD